MRVGNLFGQTLRDGPADAQIPSHQLLIRGAFIRQVAAGVYAWLPLGLRVLRKVEQIVREEMDRAGAVELLMSLLQPGELWQKSGRWDAYGPVLYRIKDRSDRDFCLAPTHEEMITTLAQTELPSYRDLPKIPYHIQWKFRDEPRPRGGLLRGREFLMKDAYSFDADEAGLQVSYEKMAAAYVASFDRCSLDPVRVEADSSDIGGSINNEFQVPCENGGDTFVGCSNGDYAANTEVASGRPPKKYKFGDAPPTAVKVHTPGKVTVADVAEQLGVEPRQLVKTLIFRLRGTDELVAAVIPGDRELNELKLQKLLGGTPELLKDDEFAKHGIAKGFSGPVRLEMRMLADQSLQDATNVATGANEADYHLTGVVPGRDFTPDAWADLIVAMDGDLCDRCGGKLVIEKGIEVGHIFQLVGADYIARLGATFTDENGKQRPFVMGCYGLGISRTVAAIVEVHHDERGIAWPKAVAPYEVCVVLLSDDPRAVSMAGELESDLEAAGVGCALDDRAGVSPGVKFADADLIGYPLQVVIGKSFLSSGKLETKVRASGEKSDVDASAEAVRALLETCL
jgi:prolyl-tRNA synthetase